jgi:subtilisin family serine protease
MTRTRQLLCGVLAVLLCVLGAPYAAAEPAPEATGRIVVKVDVRSGYTIASVTSGLPVELLSTVLASRGIYLLSSTNPDYDGDGDPTDAEDREDDQKLANDIAKRPGVLWTELDQQITLTDARFHGWPSGPSETLGLDPAIFYGQPAAIRLQLSLTHLRSQGSGVLVAVLDTGADRGHPALAGRTVSAWNYVSDTADTSDVADGVDSDDDGVLDEAVGHGTFVSGLVALVAPRARIMPARVLDSDGVGNMFAVAEAIVDSVHAGARVINLSFGTPDQVQSKVLLDALKVAEDHKVVVVSAAGNSGSSVPHFPASAAKVCGVAALGTSSQLATFSNRGTWVDVASPGERLIGPLPGGGYASWSGTSMSSALVSGQAALVRSADPGADADNTIATIEATARWMPGGVVESGSIDVLRSVVRALS